ncbi:MAG: DUF1638 domain-containing protein [Rhodospirillaceae bacterium]|jgi:hypothetical protein|nr:DUF1638 domain-containing protein [Rhodospirillaceae bacterium]
MDAIAEGPTTLVICCGAIANEIVTIVRENGWQHMKVECLPAKLHNHPEALPEGVRAKIRQGRARGDEIVVLYSDCGTGGGMARVLEEEGVENIGGSHCYEVFSGSEQFKDMMEDEPGSFFVTDFLARHFEKLVFKGLGLDRFPKLRDTYFGHYRKLVYLVQRESPETLARAEAAAASIGLELEVRHTGYGGFQKFLEQK